MWGCLLGPEKLEAEWRTGAALLCPARKLGPVGSAWPSPWPCGRPAATPACASIPCLWSSWKQKHWSLLEWRPRWRMVPAIVSGLVAVPWVPLAIASALVEAGRVPLAVASGLVAVPWVPLAHGLASVALAESTWPWVSSVVLWAPVVVSWLAWSSPCHLVGAVVASWDQVVASQGLCGSWGPWCVGGGLWSVRGSGWDGGWLHRGGATGRVLELGR